MTFKNFFFILFISSQFLSAESIADDFKNKTKELTGLQSKIKKISVKINDLHTQKHSLIADLKKLDLHYGKSAIQLSKLKSQITTINRELKKNQQKTREKQRQINTQKQALKRQIQLAYGLGKNNRLKLLFNQKDPAVSQRIMTYYDYLNKIKLQKIALINADLQQLHELKEQRKNENSLLEEKLNKQTIEQSILLKTKAKQKQLLKKIERHYASKQQQLNRFKASEYRLKTLLSKLQKTMDDFPFKEGTVKIFSELKGKLPWPVKGKIIKKFGTKRSDSRWDGVLIKAKNGTNIRAVTRGRVVYADWLRGYGLLTIIEHGKGYMTLYAFNQSLYKSVGDWVEAGAEIATVGQSGGQAESGLYFGIRKKGKPVNPEKWCHKLP